MISDHWSLDTHANKTYKGVNHLHSIKKRAKMLFNKNLSAIHAYLCADGYVIKNPEHQKHKYYHIGFRNTNNILLKDFDNNFIEYFNIKPRRSDGRSIIQNKKIYYFLTKKYSYYSSEWQMPELNKENMRYWLRAFFDCETWVMAEKAKNRLIGLDSINKEGIYQIQKALEKLDIPSKIKIRKNRKISRLYIYGKENLIKFQKEINFLYPNKKKKLDDAIESYVNYYWKFPENKKDLKKYIISLFKGRKYNRSITSIKEENLILLQKHLKELFDIDSKIYDCKRYYELDVKKIHLNRF